MSVHIEVILDKHTYTQAREQAKITRNCKAVLAEVVESLQGICITKITRNCKEVLAEVVVSLQGICITKISITRNYYFTCITTDLC